MSNSSGTLNLYLAAPEIHTDFNSLNAFLPASPSGASSRFRGVNLYLSGGNDVSGTLNLYLEGGGQSSQKQALNLFTPAKLPKGTKDSKSLDLVLYNLQSSNLSYNTLSFEDYYALNLNQLNTLQLQSVESQSNTVLGFTLGTSGSSPNAAPVSGQMNLFLQIPPGVSKGADLFLLGSDSQTSNINLYEFGVTGVASSGVDLFVSSRGLDNKILNLFTRGYTS